MFCCTKRFSSCSFYSSKYYFFLLNEEHSYDVRPKPGGGVAQFVERLAEERSNII